MRTFYTPHSDFQGFFKFEAGGKEPQTEKRKKETLIFEIRFKENTCYYTPRVITAVLFDGSQLVAYFLNGDDSGTIQKSPKRSRASAMVSASTAVMAARAAQAAAPVKPRNTNGFAPSMVLGRGKL